jgi:hypothetical protein
VLWIDADLRSAKESEIMTEIFRVAVSREHCIVGLICVSDSGGVSATADGRRVVWRAQPDRLDDSAWRTLEYLAGMTRRVDEYETSDGEDPLGYDTSLPTEAYLQQMAEDALTGRYARAVESEMARAGECWICLRQQLRPRTG